MGSFLRNKNKLNYRDSRCEIQKIPIGNFEIPYRGGKASGKKKRCYDVISFSEFEARWRHGSVSRMSRKRTDTILSRIRTDTGFSSSATNRNRNVSFAPHVTLGKLTEEPTPRFVVTLF